MVSTINNIISIDNHNIISDLMIDFVMIFIDVRDGALLSIHC